MCKEVDVNQNRPLRTQNPRFRSLHECSGRPPRSLKATVEDTSRSTGTPVAGDVGGDPVLVPQLKEDDEDWPYDWRKHWYAVAFERDIPGGEQPYGVSIFDEPLVLYRDGDGILQCVSDFCPHRASKLSEGMVTDGNIECLYHGWQFNGKDGKCVHIPQLPKDASPPRAATLRVYPIAVSEGLVYVWMGDDPWEKGAKDILPVPRTPDNLDENLPSWKYDFTYEMPFDWSYLAENLVDPAHVPISHHNTQAGGDRKNAAPLKFQLFKDGPKAANSRGFDVLLENNNKNPKMRKTDYTFRAPGIIGVRSATAKEGDLQFGAFLHAVPLGKGRSRLLFTTYMRNAPYILKLLVNMKPEALRNLNSCKIIEQDMALICAQEDYIARTGAPLSESFLPLKSSDTIVVELRKWLDRVGHGMPHFTGWKKLKVQNNLSDHEHSRLSTHRWKESRYFRHVVLSRCTRNFLKRVKLAKRGALAMSAALAAMALLLSSPLAAPAAGEIATGVVGRALAKLWQARVASIIGSACALWLGAAAHKLEGHFYENFERHPVLG